MNNNSTVWMLLRLLQVREDNEKDDTGDEPLTWSQFCNVMVDESKSPTIVCYGPVYPQPPAKVLSKHQWIILCQLQTI